MRSSVLACIPAVVASSSRRRYTNRASSTGLHDAGELPLAAETFSLEEERMARVRLFVVVGISLIPLVAGCGGDLQSPAAAFQGTVATATEHTEALEGPSALANAMSASDRCHPQGAQCHYSRGVTTCSTVVSQENVVTTTQEFSGCLTSGRRIRTYLNHYLVTTTLTTRAQGRCGQVFHSWTSKQQQLLFRDLVSDVCQP